MAISIVCNHSSGSFSSTKHILLKTGELITSNMVTGQESQLSIFTSFRSVSAVSTNLISQLVIPSTLLENSVFFPVSKLLFNVSSFPNQGIKSSLWQLSTVIMTNISLGKAASLPVLTQFSVADMCSSDPAASLIFYLPRNEFPSPSNSSFQTRKRVVLCKIDKKEQHDFVCVGDVNITVHCNGTHTYKSIITCPSEFSLPGCHITDSIGLTRPECRVVDSNASHTVCSCSVCPQDDGSNVIGVNGRQLQSVNETGVLGVVALVVSSFTTFREEFQSVHTLNVYTIFQNCNLVIFTFAVLWLGMPLAVFTLSWARSHQHDPNPSGKKENSNKKMSDVPTSHFAESYLKTFFETVQSGMENKLSEIPIMKVFSLSGDGMLRKNPYLILFRILTNICFGMFMLAFFYNMQIPTDDGSCSMHEDKDSCVSSKSYFDSRYSSCDWSNITTATGTIPVFTCRWAQPKVSIFVFVLFTVFVVVVSAPVQVLLDSIFDTVVFAPSSHPLDNETVRRIRRATIVALNTMSTVVAKKNFFVFDITVEMAEEITSGRKLLLKKLNGVDESVKSEKLVWTLQIMTEKILKQRLVMSKTTEVELFDTEWGIENVDGIPVSLLCRDYSQLLQEELSSVDSVVASHLSRMTSLANSLYGPKLMELF